MRCSEKVGTRQPCIWLLALVMASMVLTPERAPASIWLATGSGKDGPVTGQADISLGTNTITVVLTDLLSAAQFKSPGQALSDIVFSLSGNVSIASATVSASGTAVNIDDKGKTTSAPGTTTKWKISSSKGHFLLTPIGGGQPSYMIAPSGSSYPNVNKGVQNFDPYFQGSATITISKLSGVTSNTTVSDVALSFGTSNETEIAAHAVPAPPSAIIAMSGVGVIGCVALVIYRRRIVLGS